MALFGRRRAAPYLENSITEGVIWKNLLSFFFPILLGTFFQQMYNTVDAIIVGKFVGTEALAAVGGTTGTIINLIVGFFVGMSSGATVILSQFYGGRRHQEVSDTVHTAIALAVAGGLFIMALGLALAPAMLRMLDTPEELVGYSMSYIRIYFIGMVPSLIYNIGSGLLRAVGDSRRPLLFLIAACMTNIVLDVVFVVGFEMHVAGAALATILSQAVSATLIIITLMRSHTSYRLEIKKIRFHGQLLKRIITIGLPAGLQSMAYSVSNAIVQTSINGFGTSVMAAYTAYGKLDAFNWMLQNAFGVSITTFVGQNYGAGRLDRVRESAKKSLVFMALVTLAVSEALLLTARPLLRLLTDEPAVIDTTWYIILLFVPFYVLWVPIEVLSGVLRGVGDVLIPSLILAGGICGFRILWLLTAFRLSPVLLTLCVCYPLSWLVTDGAIYLYFRRSRVLTRAARVIDGDPIAP